MNTHRRTKCQIGRIRTEKWSHARQYIPINFTSMNLFIRCGLIHARGLAPTTKVSQQEIQDYCKQFETKISTLVTTNQVVTPAELTKLGAKDPEKYPFMYINGHL